MNRIKNYPKRPQTKIAGKWILLTEEYTDVPGYKMSEAIKDVLEIADRNWFAYLGRLINRWEENPFENHAYRNDPNLWIALQAKGYVCISKEEILQKAEAHFQELTKS